MKFKSKPVEIEAVQLTAQLMSAIEVGTEPQPNGLHRMSSGAWYCFTRQGNVVAVEGDWIIQESDGSGCYPCKPDVFADKYDPA